MGEKGRLTHKHKHTNLKQGRSKSDSMLERDKTQARGEGGKEERTAVGEGRKEGGGEGSLASERARTRRRAAAARAHSPSFVGRVRPTGAYLRRWVLFIYFFCEEKSSSPGAGRASLPFPSLGGSGNEEAQAGSRLPCEPRARFAPEGRRAASERTSDRPCLLPLRLFLLPPPS